MSKRPIILSLFLSALLAGTADSVPPTASWILKAPPLAEPEGEVIRVTSTDELFEAVRKIPAGGTISLADGLYRLPRYLEISTDDVTLRSESGDRHRVVLDGSGSRHGELLGITGCEGVTIADLTVQNVKWNGIKINSDRGAQRVSIYNCVLHNIWQRGVKAPAIPEGKPDSLAPRDCRIQYCLFYNDRPKRFADDETDTPKTYNGNYIGGIDVKNTVDWKITDNVFLGIQGRTREGRGSIYISENGRGCVIERNLFIDCDIGIAIGNPSLGYSPLQADSCTAKDNLVMLCLETGILACHTRNCTVSNNTIYEPESKMRRLIWIQNANGGLRVEDNLLIGPPIQITSESTITQSRNEAHPEFPTTPTKVVGQPIWTPAQIEEIITWLAQRKATADSEREEGSQLGAQPPEVIAAMRAVHEGFKGQRGYVAQFGDSITYSMAFWSAMDWDDPAKFLTQDDGLPKAPEKLRWRDYIKGARDKGQKFANYSGWKVGNLLKSVDAVLAEKKPEAAIIMIGTNDINGGAVPATYRADLDQVITKCLEAHCVPILNTIPPRRGKAELVDEINGIIREIATTRKIPLADYHAEILRLRPENTWDGTLISDDGIHPSGGKSNLYDAENLKSCGYALRNWVNFLVLRQIYFRVFEAQE